MLQTLKLLIPALIPSWRFFDTIAPSPRIEFTLLEAADAPPVDWEEFRPRPSSLTFGSMIKRMIWNPWWNETLFLISCAERLEANPTEHSKREILNRLIVDLKKDKRLGKGLPYLQFRLVFLSRHETGIQKEVTYTSPVYRYSEDALS